MNLALMLGLVGLVIITILTVLRVSGLSLFLSVLTGKLLAETAAGDIYSFLNGKVEINSIQYVQLAVLALPVILTVLITRRSNPKTKLISNGLIIFASVISLLAVMNSYIQVGAVQELTLLDQGKIAQYQGYIIGLSTLFVLLLSWVESGLKHKSKKHH